MNDDGDHPEKEPAERDAQLLDRYLKDRDAKCPTCGYNLRNLRSGVCPECEARIELRIGEREINLVLFALTIAPGVFTGIAAALLLVLAMLFGPPPPQLGIVFFLGIISAAVVIGIVCSGDAFVRQRRAAQASWACLVWLIHFIVFVVFITAV